MKTEAKKVKTAKHELRSLDDFNKRFYPNPMAPEDSECPPDADDVGEKLVKESLDRLQAALAVK